MSTKNIPWVEKYRPVNVHDIVYQDEVVSMLNGVIESGNLPHLLFHGPSGTGKTTMGLALAHQLFGSKFNTHILELNASDDRGIMIVRKKIKNFAGQSVGSDPNHPPFKIIILDETDNMTEDAQNALRRTIELYSHCTRFIIICNYISHIIDPIKSRCAKFRFKALEGPVMEKHLSSIALAEGKSISKDTLSTIANVSDGDMRKAITLLQTCICIHSDDFNKEDVKKVR